MKPQFIISFLLLFIILLISCTEDEDVQTPIVDDGMESKIAAIVSDQNQALLKDLGITVNAGNTPPNIVGNFRISPKTLQATTNPNGNKEGHVFPDAGIRFFDQVGENIKVQGINFIGEEFLAQNAILLGSGNNFTVFAKGTAKIGTNTANFDLILTGAKEGNGIRNLKAAYTNTNNSNGGGKFIPQGTAELIYDGGSTSEAINALEEILEKEPEENDEDNGAEGEGVYVVGFQRQRSTNLNVATLWHNGEVKILENEGKSTIATGVTMMGNDLLIAGHMRATPNTAQGNAVYWKNDELIKLSEENSKANAVLAQGSDLYFVGSFNNKAAYWKNGSVQELSSRGTSSEAHGIFVENGAVYIVGRETLSGKNIGVLWKNGVPGYLSESSRNVNLFGVGVLNGDIYVAGGENHPDSGPTSANLLYARFWKNGEATWLLDGPGNSQAKAVKIHNGQVHLIYDEVADGFGNNNLYVMKGSEKTQIFTGKPSGADAIAVKGNDILVAGHISYQAAYFMNQTEIILPKSTPTLDYAQTGAYGIYVKE